MHQNIVFQSIAVIGAGTMGRAIAGQIANAGLDVLLLDMPDDGGGDVNARALDAVARLKASEPPALFSKDVAARIAVGNIRDDLGRLADADWVIEAVVERLDVKQALYKDLQQVIRDDAVVTSNTSTIPISVLMAGMPENFRRRFAITHYFNPVRYMRLLELVAGADSAGDVMARLKDMNDRILGKGVVMCRDTPGFLGNRVGVFALQVGLAAAHRHGLSCGVADAVMGRPMGLPKTGIFGLYDLIGVDLMADVVATLAKILPADDAFHEVGAEANPLAPLIADMLAAGHKGDKSGGGFYREDKKRAVNLTSGAVEDVGVLASPLLVRANAMLAAGDDPLPLMIAPPDDAEDAPPEDMVLVAFAREVLARIFAYAGGLIPHVTHTPQTIDDAMKLGFNWQRGVFEMMDALGHEAVEAMMIEAGLEVPPVLSAMGGGAFYRPEKGVLLVAQFDETASVSASGMPPNMAPVNLPSGTIRLHQLRRCLTPILRNRAASLYALDGDVRLVEFHSKANALTDDSMAVVAAAASDHGRGIIIHNDAQHFSAGVDLAAVLALIRAQDWHGIDGFLQRFQDAVQALRDAPVPVIAAPSGLAIGGGYEVILHADQTIAHGNSVFGLVEAGVGLVPGGGGVKETLRRWLDACADAEKAAWETWMQIGYARTGTSPELSARLQYFLPARDKMEMNRDKLMVRALAAIEAFHQAGYVPPPAPELRLPGCALLERMEDFMDEGVAKNMFSPHDKTVAMAVGGIVVGENAEAAAVGEDDMFARERRAFLQLAQTPETLARIANLMEGDNEGDGE